MSLLPKVVSEIIMKEMKFVLSLEVFEDRFWRTKTERGQQGGSKDSQDGQNELLQHRLEVRPCRKLLQYPQHNMTKLIEMTIKSKEYVQQKV